MVELPLPMVAPSRHTPNSPVKKACWHVVDSEFTQASAARRHLIAIHGKQSFVRFAVPVVMGIQSLTCPFLGGVVIAWLRGIPVRCVTAPAGPASRPSAHLPHRKGKLSTGPPGGNSNYPPPDPRMTSRDEFRTCFARMFSLTFSSFRTERRILPPSRKPHPTIYVRQERGTQVSRRSGITGPAWGEVTPSGATGHLPPEPDSSPRRRRRGPRHARTG